MPVSFPDVRSLGRRLCATIGKWKESFLRSRRTQIAPFDDIAPAPRHDVEDMSQEGALSPDLPSSRTRDETTGRGPQITVAFSENRAGASSGVDSVGDASCQDVISLFSEWDSLIFSEDSDGDVY